MIDNPKGIGKKIKENYQLYILLALPLIWLILFKYVPMYGAQIAFRKYYANKGIWGSPWVGLKYFKRFIESYNFERVLINTIGISFYQLLAGFPFPILLALGLNTTLNKGYKKVVQFITYMPHFISTVVMVSMILQVLNPQIGVINTLFHALGRERVDFIGIPEYFKSIYVWSGVWQNIGWSSIIYLATLSSVDTQLYEAAEIDGASRFQRILHIDIPCLLPTAVILLIIQTGRVMNIGFEKVFLMQNPLNIKSSEIISTYVYKVGLASTSADFSYSTAIGLFRSIINLALIVSVNQIAKKMGESSLW